MSSLKTVFHPTFVSYRRSLIDEFLNKHLLLMQGVVLDLGGKKKQKRGAFRPPLSETSLIQWLCVNLDSETEPDLFCDVCSVPLADNSVDCVLCTEVLEHLPDPRKCVNEAYRLLKPGAVFIATVPFLYPVHPDPKDYQRFTDDGIQVLLSDFDIIHLTCMGGVWGTLGLLIEIIGWHTGKSLRGKIIRKITKCFGRLLISADIRYPYLTHLFPNGYGVVARKKLNAL